MTEQIVFLIATQRLRDGELLPSVRELAREQIRPAGVVRSSVPI